MAERDIEEIRRIIGKHLEEGDAVGWFDELYRWAGDDTGAIPWAGVEPRRDFAEWAAGRDRISGSALVIGCGLGGDAELLARMGASVTAFDVSPTAIEWCHKLFPDSPVNYRVADLFDPPEEWTRAFDLVLEDFIVQALPPQKREESVAACSHFVAAGGSLLAIGRGIDDESLRSGPPWPLTPAEIDLFDQQGLERVEWQRRDDPDLEPVFRYVARFQRPDSNG